MKMAIKGAFLSLIILGFFLQSVNCSYGGHDLFTSLSQLMDLWKNEQKIAEEFESLSESLEALAFKLKRYVRSFRENGLDQDTNYEYLGHPINAFHLIRHVAMGWKDIREKVLPLEKEMREKFDKIHERENLQLPDFEDVKGAAFGIARLISLYEINCTTMAKEGRIVGNLGEWQKVESDSSFLPPNSWDITAIASQAASNNLLNAGVDMFQQAIIKLKEEENNLFSGQELFDLHEPPMPLGEVQRNLNRTIKYHDETLKRRGNISGAHRTHDEPILARPKKKKSKKKPSSSRKRFAIMNDPIRSIKDYQNSFKNEDLFWKSSIQTDLLCAGHKFRDPKEEKDLRCFYAVGKDNPWLKLGPIKTEMLSYDPYVAAFREILFDNECNNLTQYLSPNLSFPPGRMRGGAKNDWTMKNTWPLEDDNPILDRLTNRVEALLDIRASSSKDESDRFMCGNYGIGGHYGTHPDFHDYNEKEFLDSGSRVNRISTVMTIIQSPSAGGATVFPYAGAFSYPEQGTGVSWFNLYDDGVPDQMTRHAACPILLGQKWIGNKWIGYTPQFQNKPCSLHPNGKMSGPLPKK